MSWVIKVGDRYLSERMGLTGKQGKAQRFADEHVEKCLLIARRASPGWKKARKVLLVPLRERKEAVLHESKMLVTRGDTSDWEGFKRAVNGLLQAEARKKGRS